MLNHLFNPFCSSFVLLFWRKDTRPSLCPHRSITSMSMVWIGAHRTEAEFQWMPTSWKIVSFYTRTAFSFLLLKCSCFLWVLLSHYRVFLTAFCEPQTYDFIWALCYSELFRLWSSSSSSSPPCILFSPAPASLPPLTPPGSQAHISPLTHVQVSHRLNKSHVSSPIPLDEGTSKCDTLLKAELKAHLFHKMTFLTVSLK